MGFAPVLGDAGFEKSDTARAGVAPTGIPPVARFFFFVAVLDIVLGV